jgi:hypothetical protein
MSESVLFVILAPVYAVGGWAMAFAAARIETRRTGFHAKRFAAPYLPQMNKAPPAEWRRRRGNRGTMR